MPPSFRARLQRDDFFFLFGCFYRGFPWSPLRINFLNSAFKPISPARLGSCGPFIDVHQNNMLSRGSLSPHRLNASSVVLCSPLMSKNRSSPLPPFLRFLRLLLPILPEHVAPLDASLICWFFLGRFNCCFFFYLRSSLALREDLNPRV